jgi:hypothetical protein
VLDSVARGKYRPGLLVTGTVGYRSNVFTSNNGGDANPQTNGGCSWARTSAGRTSSARETGSCTSKS